VLSETAASIASVNASEVASTPSPFTKAVGVPRTPASSPRSRSASTVASYSRSTAAVLTVDESAPTSSARDAYAFGSSDPWLAKSRSAYSKKAASSTVAWTARAALGACHETVWLTGIGKSWCSYRICSLSTYSERI